MQLISLIAYAVLFTNGITDNFELPLNNSELAVDNPELIASKIENYHQDVESFLASVSSLSLQDTYSAYHLKNKLEVVIHEHNDSKKPFEASVSVGVGSTGVSKKYPVLQQPIPDGMAHLLEHCMFFQNDKSPTPYEINRFIKLNGIDLNACTSTDHTKYFVKFKKGFSSEGLKRFASLFISPKFTTEAINVDVTAINNEWLWRRDQSSSVYRRLPQLFMTEGQPSERFACGNAETFGGDSRILVEQVQQFWKTHYTADNMKLAISVHKMEKPLVEKILIDYFAKIPSSDAEKIASFSNDHLWSQVHDGKFLKAYLPNNRRNSFNFYWNIHCDEGAVCRDSLEMIVGSIKDTLRSTFSDRSYRVFKRVVSYNEFIIEINIQVRNKELSRLTSLKDQIIETVRMKTSLSTACEESSFEFDNFKNYTERLSEVMLFTSSLKEVPLRAHANYIVDAMTKKLKADHLNVLRTKDPRIAISYKFPFWKDEFAKESVSLDPYHPIYYQFVDNLEDDSALLTKPSVIPDSSISLTIKHPELTYPFSFFRGLFVEMLRIILKNKRLEFKSSLENNSFSFEIYLENAASWESTMQSVMDEIENPSNIVFEKAKNRWLREIQSEESNMYSNDIALEYARILTNEKSSNEYIQLIADSNPENVSIEKVSILKDIFNDIDVKVNFKSMSNEADRLNNNDVISKMKSIWNKKIIEKKCFIKFEEPTEGQTFIFAPTPISKENSGIVVLFKFDWKNDYLLMLFEKILSTFFVKRLRHEMKLTYAPMVGHVAEFYLYTIIASPLTPDVLQNSIFSVIKEIPDYIRELTESEWKMQVNNLANTRLRDQLLISNDARQELITKIMQFLSDEATSSRLILQFWGKDQCEARNSYLAENKAVPPPRTKIFVSIEEIPSIKICKDSAASYFDEF